MVLAQLILKSPLNPAGEDTHLSTKNESEKINIRLKHELNIIMQIREQQQKSDALWW